jgi:hypothetical protein
MKSGNRRRLLHSKMVIEKQVARWPDQPTARRADHSILENLLLGARICLADQEAAHDPLRL